MSATLVPQSVEAPAPVAAPAPAAGDAPDTSRRTSWIVGVVALAVGLLAMNPYAVGVYSDDGVYAILARSLAEGHGFRFLHLPGEPAATHFPPVYPAMLAVLWKLWPAFPENVALFKFANVAFNALAAVFAFRLAHRTVGLPRGVAVAAALAGTLGIPALILAGLVMSEPLFLMGLLALLPAAERLRTMDDDARAVRHALLVGLALGVLTLTRSLGVAAGAGIVGALVLSRRWRLAAVVAVGALALVAPWEWWVAANDGGMGALLQGKYGSYGGWLAAGIERRGPGYLLDVAAVNARAGWTVVSSPVAPPGFFGLAFPSWLVYPVLLVPGVVRLARRAPMTLLTWLAYVAIVLLWPFEPARFLWGVWPLFVLPAAAGAVAWWEHARASSRPALRRVPAVLGGMVLVGAAVNAAVGLALGWQATLARTQSDAALAALRWSLHRAPADAVIASDAEAMVWLYTGRRGVPVTTFTPDEYLDIPSPAQRATDLCAIVRTYGVHAVVASSPETMHFATLASQGASPCLRQVEFLRPGAVYLPVAR